MTPQDIQTLEKNPVYKAFKEGKQIQFQYFLNDWRDVTDIHLNNFFENINNYRIKPPTKFPAPPEGEEWHNPDNLTPEQVEVDKGWRLILKSEVENAKKSSVKIENVELWSASGWNENAFGNSGTISYRTNIPLPPKVKINCCFKEGEEIVACRNAKDAKTIKYINSFYNEVIFTDNTRLHIKEVNSWFKINKLSWSDVKSGDFVVFKYDDAEDIGRVFFNDFTKAFYLFSLNSESYWADRTEYSLPELVKILKVGDVEIKINNK